jgi:hypothetical protein
MGLRRGFVRGCLPPRTVAPVGDRVDVEIYDNPVAQLVGDEFRIDNAFRDKPPRLRQVMSDVATLRDADYPTNDERSAKYCGGVLLPSKPS